MKPTVAADGFQTIKNTFFGDPNSREETWNMHKRLFKTLSPEYGEDIYSLTQIGIGAFSAVEGVVAIPSSVGKTYTWGSNIRNAKTWGSKTQTQLTSIGSALVIETKTEAGLILQRTILDGRKLTGQSISVILDGYGIGGSTNSLID